MLSKYRVISLIVKLVDSSDWLLTWFNSIEPSLPSVFCFDNLFCKISADCSVLAPGSLGGFTFVSGGEEEPGHSCKWWMTVLSHWDDSEKCLVFYRLIWLLSAVQRTGPPWLLLAGTTVCTTLLLYCTTHCLYVLPQSLTIVCNAHNTGIMKL